MIGEIFYWVLNVSILGSAAGLIVLILRRIRVLPRFGVYLLWALPFVRLWMPVGLSSKYSLLTLVSQYATKTIIVGESAPGSPGFSMTNSVQAAESYFPVVYKSDLLRTVFNIAGMVWLLMAAAAVLCNVILYIITKSTLKDAKHTKGNIYISDKVLSPAVYGIIKPRIILPATVSTSDINYILEHERIHIRRLDNLWRVIAVITSCVHWFNPLVWIFLKYFLTDMELACDAGVLKKLDEGGKKTYASVLLSCAAGKTYYASAFAGAKTKLRIENILSYKKLTLASGICFAVFFTIIAIAVMTNAAG